MTRLFPIAFLLTILSHASDLQWHGGSVVLVNGKVVTGDIARQSADLILVRTSMGVAVYNSYRVQSFRYFDKAQDINRKFVAVQALDRGMRMTFYEVVLEGRLRVIRKQKGFHESLDEDASENFEYFIYSGGDLVSIKRFRSRFYEIIREELEHEGSITKLNPNHPADAILMIRLFNQAPPRASTTSVVSGFTTDLALRSK